MSDHRLLESESHCPAGRKPDRGLESASGLQYCGVVLEAMSSTCVERGETYQVVGKPNKLLTQHSLMDSGAIAFLRPFSVRPHHTPQLMIMCSQIYIV